MGRRRFRCGVGDVNAAADLFFHLLQFASQLVDLPPLRGDGRVQFFDGLVLEGDARFQGVQAFGKLTVGHGLFLLAMLLAADGTREQQSVIDVNGTLSGPAMLLCQSIAQRRPGMATSNTVSKQYLAILDVDRHNLLGLVLSAALPLAVFVIANGIAEINGMLPLFFSPLGLPGWFGAVLHLGSLPLLGITRWMVVARGPAGRAAGWWVVAFMAGTIVFPFLVSPLDALLLSLAAIALFIVGMGAVVRVAAVDAKAALIMAPGLAWMGFSAFVGLSFAAAW